MGRRAPFGLAVALALGLTLASCAHSGTNPTSLADRTTKAVYDLDIDATGADMDDALKSQLTRSSLGDLSDRMHSLGQYKGLKQTSGDADRGRYAFEAGFDRGTLDVDLRLDPSGKIGAYRVSPSAK